LINEKHGQGTHSTKMGADKSAKISQMSPNLSAQIVCPSPKDRDFDEKRLHWAFVARVGQHFYTMILREKKRVLNFSLL
jgi:hypothetical protein